MNALLNSAWDAVCDEPSDKLVLVYLADRANVNGKAWPHLPTIARQTGLCKRTIIRAVERLESQKLLTVERKAGCSNRYVIHPIADAPAGVTKSPVTRRHLSGVTMSPLPVTPCHQHPNPHGTPRGTGKPSPRSKREGWQLLRDEESLTKRIKTEAESCKPDKDLIEALKLERRNVRDEMKSKPPP